MYLSHFQLSEKPFKASPDPRYLWLGARQRDAVAKVTHGILHEKGIQVVTGGIGTGKTTFAHAILSELGERAIAAVVPYPDIDRIDYFRLIVNAYGLKNNTQGGESASAQLSTFLHDSFAAGKRVALIIDEAQRLSDTCIEELLDLSGAELNGTGLLSIVLVGQNELRDRLSDPAFGEVSRRVTLSLTMNRLTRDETAQYISHRLKVAQCSRELFTPEAIDEIFAFSHGVPRLINRACDVALSRTYFTKGNTVLPDTVKQYLKLIQDERTAIVGLVTDRPVEAEQGPVTEKETAGRPVVEEVPGEGTLKQRWHRIAYAALGFFIAVALGYSFVMMKSDEPPPSTRQEPKKEKASQEMRTTPEAPSPAESQIRAPMSSPRPRASGTPKGEAPVTQAVKQKRREPGGTGTPATQGEGVVRREPPERAAAEEPDPDKVIDWLLKKRSEKR